MARRSNALAGLAIVVLLIVLLAGAYFGGLFH